MLAEQDWSISEISERTGYQDVSYFIRVFAKRYGITPLVYRKRIRSEIEETHSACPQEAVHETPVFPLVIGWFKARRQECRACLCIYSISGLYKLVAYKRKTKILHMNADLMGTACL